MSAVPLSHEIPVDDTAVCPPLVLACRTNPKDYLVVAGFSTGEVNIEANVRVGTPGHEDSLVTMNRDQVIALIAYLELLLELTATP